jgi:molybdate transport system substrate-binding protein
MCLQTFANGFHDLGHDAYNDLIATSHLARHVHEFIIRGSKRDDAMNRSNPIPWLAAVSIVVLAGLIFLLYESSKSGANAGTDRPVRVYCAAALKPVMQNIAADYQKETGQQVEFEFGDSGHMLGNVTTRLNGDLFLPADSSFVRLAEERGLVAEAFPVCRMRAVILTRPGNPHNIAKFEDLLKPGLKIAIANPDKAAIGKVVRDHLVKIGKWDAVASHLEVQHTTVIDSANAVQLGSIDAAIVWDSVAINYQELTAVHVKELDGAVGKVEIVILNSATNPTGAWQLASYTSASDRGLVQFRKWGFKDVEKGVPWVPHAGGP